MPTQRTYPGVDRDHRGAVVNEAGTVGCAVQVHPFLIGRQT